MPRCYVAIGSNLGDRLEQARAAVRGLGRLGRVTARSSLWRAAPVGGPPGQPEYLNAVVAFDPGRQLPGPRALLAALLGIEREQGRERRERWAARTLDLDLLAWGDLVVEEEGLALPHPRMMYRAFVLAPLAEIAPGWRHPVSGVTPAEALATLDAAGVERTDLSWAGKAVSAAGEE